MPAFSRLKPIAAPMLKRLLSPQEPDIEVVHPAETQSVQHPRYLQGMLDRVTSTPIPSQLEHHLEVVTAQSYNHAAVLRKTLRNVLVYPAGYAAWRKDAFYSPKRDLSGLKNPIVHVPKLRFCMNSVVWRYFGHWMSDAVPSSLIDPDEGALWIRPDPSWQHAQEYLDIFEISPLEAPLVHAKELVFYQDFGQGSHKRARYAELQNRVRKSLGNPDLSDYVYLRRGATGSRRVIANEDALVEKLTAMGWKIFDIGSASAKEMQQTICKAKVVLGIEGSHINHAQYGLAAKTALVILIPNDRFVTLHLARASAKNIASGFVVLEGTNEAGYLVNVDEVLRTVDLTLSSS